MYPTFAPQVNVFNNVQKYAGLKIRGDVSLLPCVITKVYKNARADIYIPNTSTVMNSIPMIFSSFGEEQGDVILPEENTLSLFLSAADGRRFVLGGFSLSETYVVRNILPGESERYLKNSSYKQDVIGNHIFLSRLGAIEVLKGDGEFFMNSNSSYENTGSTECLSGEYSFRGTNRRFEYKKIFSAEYGPGNEISSETEILSRNNAIKEKIQSYLVEMQNLKDTFTEESYLELKKSIAEKYKIQKRVAAIIEIGTVFDEKSGDMVYGLDNTPLIYRERFFDQSENLSFSFSVSEGGEVLEWEPVEEAILNHGLDDYPAVSLLLEDPNSSYLKSLEFETIYLDKQSLKVSLKRKYGAIIAIENKSPGYFEINMHNGAKIIAQVSYSPAKMMEVVKRMNSAE